jgi:acyl-CoA synthetase (AMP-forming)/AMP-acid ligase II
MGRTALVAHRRCRHGRRRRTITLLGRGSICINTGGEKVHPEEVEAVLRRSDNVYDVLVVGAPDDRSGQDPRPDRGAPQASRAGIIEPTPVRRRDRRR